MKLTWLRRAAVAALVAAAAGLLVSCGQSKPWWYHWRALMCGPPALMQLNGHLMGLGSCAGYAGFPADKVTLHVGKQLDIHMTQDGAIPLPRSSRPFVVRRTAITPDRATGSYQAARPGHAVLFSEASCLALRGQARQTASNCLVIDVTVVP